MHNTLVSNYVKIIEIKLQDKIYQEETQKCLQKLKINKRQIVEKWLIFFCFLKSTLFFVRFVTSKWDEHPYKIKQKSTVIKNGHTAAKQILAFKKLYRARM